MQHSTYYIELMEKAGHWITIHVSSTYQVCMSWYRRFVAEYPSDKIRIREM